MTCFYDVGCLPCCEIKSCTEQAGASRVLICVLDDKFPSRWCLKEIEAAISSQVPIIPIFDQNQFKWEEVGKPAWWTKKVCGRRIPGSIVQAVFARGAIHFNGHPDYIDLAENLCVKRLLSLLARD